MPPSVRIISQQRELLASTPPPAIFHGIVARALAARIVEGQSRIRPREPRMHHEDLVVQHVRQRQPAPTAREALEELSALETVAGAQLRGEAVPRHAISIRKYEYEL